MSNNNLDLNKLQEKLDQALSNETHESLSNWLEQKRIVNMEYSEKQSSVDWLESKIQSHLATYGSISPKMVSVFASYSKMVHKKEHEHTYNQHLMSNYQTFDHYYSETFK